MEGSSPPSAGYTSLSGRGRVSYSSLKSLFAEAEVEVEVLAEASGDFAGTTGRCAPAAGAGAAGDHPHQQQQKQQHCGLQPPRPSQLSSALQRTSARPALGKQASKTYGLASFRSSDSLEAPPGGAATPCPTLQYSGRLRQLLQRRCRKAAGLLEKLLEQRVCSVKDGGEAELLPKAALRFCKVGRAHPAGNVWDDAAAPMGAPSMYAAACGMPSAGSMGLAANDMGPSGPSIQPSHHMHARLPARPPAGPGLCDAAQGRAGGGVQLGQRLCHPAPAGRLLVGALLPDHAIRQPGADTGHADHTELPPAAGAWAATWAGGVQRRGSAQPASRQPASWPGC